MDCAVPDGALITPCHRVLYVVYVVLARDDDERFGRRASVHHQDENPVLRSYRRTHLPSNCSIDHQKCSRGGILDGDR